MTRVADKVGNYRLMELLGTGGFAQVFVGQHGTFGHTDAIKVLHPQYVTNEKVRERFKREARLQHKHSHPNIVRILDIIDEPGLAAIVMEHIVGVDLDTHLEGDWAGRFSPEDAMLLMDPLLDAVKFIHERGIVHRDLKPSNILLDEAHGTWPPVPKLTDFGIAKLLEAEVGHTKTGARMGSWVYGAPEQFRSAGKVSPAADVFSLGMMLRRMLTGELPVDPDDEAAVWGFYLGHIALRPLREEAPELPAGLVEILDQAVAIDPAARPADADAFATLLDRALASAGVRRDGAGADAPEISPAPPAQEKTPASEAQEVPGSEAQEAPASEEQEAPGSEAQEAPSPEPEAPSPEETPPPAEEAPAAPLELVTPSPVETSTSDDGEVSLEVPQASAMGWFMAAAAVTFMGLGLWFSGGDPAPASPRTDARPSAPRAEEPGAVAPARQAKAEAKVEPAVPEPPPPPELPPGFVYVPAGTYPIGCQGSASTSRCLEDQRPGRQVTVAGFGLQRHEVTMEAYDQCVADGRCPKPKRGKNCNWQRSGREDHPINCVSWEGATAYCGAHRWRLPTEVEWEVAARGPNGSTFPWSSQAPYCQKLNKDRIQMTGESPAEVDRRMAKNGHSAPHARCGGGRHGTIEGGGYGLDVSWIGVEDLGGNVREWVADEYAAYPGGRTNPGLSGRVNRGGSWSMSPSDIANSRTRMADDRKERRSDLGFRCAVTP